MPHLFQVVALLACLSVLGPAASAQSNYQRQTASQLCAQAYTIGIQQQHYSEGINLLLQAQQLTPNDHWIPSTIATSYMHMNEYAEAAPYLERAIALSPADPAEVEAITFCYYRLKRPGKVIGFAEPYLAVNGSNLSTVNIWQRVARAKAYTGNYAGSYEAYKHYLGFCSTDPAAWYAACQDFQSPAGAQYLALLYNEYAMRFPNHVGVAYMAQRARLMTQMSQATASAEEVDSFEQMMAAQDPNLPKVSMEFYGMIKEGMRAIPEFLWKPLMDYGCKIKLARYVTDIRRDLVDTHPNGHDANATFRMIPGIFDFGKKTLIVAEFSETPDGKSQPNYDPSGIMCHEIGHALDMYIGNGKDKTRQNPTALFSKGKPFSDAYQADIAAVPASTKATLSYFCQPYPAGQMEVFAQIFPILYDDSAVIGSRDDLLSRSFPRTLALAAARLHIEPKLGRPLLPVSPPVPFVPPINQRQE